MPTISIFCGWYFTNNGRKAEGFLLQMPSDKAEEVWAYLRSVGTEPDAQLDIDGPPSPDDPTLGNPGSDPDAPTTQEEK